MLFVKRLEGKNLPLLTLRIFSEPGSPWRALFCAELYLSASNMNYSSLKGLFSSFPKVGLLKEEGKFKTKNFKFFACLNFFARARFENRLAVIKIEIFNTFIACIFPRFMSKHRTTTTCTLQTFPYAT